MLNAILFLLDIIVFFSVGIVVAMICVEGHKETEYIESFSETNDMTTNNKTVNNTKKDKTSSKLATESETVTKSCLSKIDKSHSYSDFEIDASDKDTNSYIREKMKTQESKFRSAKK